MRSFGKRERYERVNDVLPKLPRFVGQTIKVEGIFVDKRSDKQYWYILGDIEPSSICIPFLRLRTVSQLESRLGIAMQAVAQVHTLPFDPLHNIKRFSQVSILGMVVDENSSGEYALEMQQATFYETDYQIHIGENWSLRDFVAAEVLPSEMIAQFSMNASDVQKVNLKGKLIGNVTKNLYYVVDSTALSEIVDKGLPVDDALATQQGIRIVDPEVCYLIPKAIERSLQGDLHYFHQDIHVCGSVSVSKDGNHPLQIENVTRFAIEHYEAIFTFN